MQEKGILRFSRKNTLWQNPEKKNQPFWKVVQKYRPEQEIRHQEDKSFISLQVKRRGGKKVIYDGHVKAALAKIWEIFDYPCGQRLAPLLKTEVDRLRQQEEIFISDEIAEKLKKISPKPLPSFKTSKTGSSPEKKVPSKEKSFNLPEDTS